jgi:uncharacterized protein (TIGR00725 family)
MEKKLGSKLTKKLEEKLAPIRCIRCTVAVSGAAQTGHCAIDAPKRAEQIGREVARAGMVLLTGATTGMPYYAAKGAKEAGGFVVGFSPASSEAAHVKTYRLPLDFHDIIIYTGFEYAGRDLLLTRAADAVVILCGRLGTLHEFTTSFEDKKPIGILEKMGGTSEMIPDILKKAHRGPGRVVYSEDPRTLIEKLAGAILQSKQDPHEPHRRW